MKAGLSPGKDDKFSWRKFNNQGHTGVRLPYASIMSGLMKLVVVLFVSQKEKGGKNYGKS